MAGIPQGIKLREGRSSSFNPKNRALFLIPYASELGRKPQISQSGRNRQPSALLHGLLNRLPYEPTL
ncbi:MAG: hypothetical protein D6710_09700 [Nitrospirae bacterium]|nr:MAG: hypothetical protein D6710_09700 [Nitrospirota bacterium]